MSSEPSAASAGPVSTTYVQSLAGLRRRAPRRWKRSRLLAPLAVLMVTVGAIAAVWLLVARADSGSVAQLQINSLKLSVADLQAAPYAADPALGAPAATTAWGRIQIDQRAVTSGLQVGAQTGVPISLLAAARADLAALEPVVGSVYRIAVHKGGLRAAGATRVLSLERLTVVRGANLLRVLNDITRVDAARAATARTQTRLGASGAMLLLLAAFAYFYFRSMTARDALERLARKKGEEARTDSLTNLSNRRALTADLASAIADPSVGPGRPLGELLVVMLDLDGFKQYNDTFGHPAGDALLHRLGGRLEQVAGQHSASAFRTGGDEFCVLSRCEPANAERLLNDTIAALEDGGEGWHIGCSHGAVWIPSEARTESQALRLADERLYANKASRSSPSRQVTDALLQVITEQSVSLDEHVERVSGLAEALASAIGQPHHEVERIRLAAQLHDIGKTAIPVAILDKPGVLEEADWEFMRRHPAIGARIVSAAPALANTAPLIHSSHERMDGTGYPDGLEGAAIPLGSRIIAVCDAFEAMTSDRVYRRGITVDAALEELKRHAGTQFDAAIVEAFCHDTMLPQLLPHVVRPEAIKA
jgi:diguanylate cyclase (GGDEF)-like protein